MKALILLALLLSGCAPKAPPQELVDARLVYRRAVEGPAAGIVPDALHDAQEALGDAELAFDEHPQTQHTRDLAYVALRKAQTAEALARAELEEQAKLREQQEAMRQAQADLAASEAARAEAERRAQEALQALSDLAAVKEDARGLVITLNGSVLFRFDEAELMPEARTRLDQVADALLSTPDRPILVEGHTDAQGSDTYNLDLSQRRADAVRAYFVERGYTPTLIEARGIGEARPVADNTTAEGRANNRRVEIVVQQPAQADVGAP